MEFCSPEVIAFLADIAKNSLPQDLVPSGQTVTVALISTNERRHDKPGLCQEVLVTNKISSAFLGILEGVSIDAGIFIRNAPRDLNGPTLLKMQLFNFQITTA
ncbi:hypothetical protein TWF569_009771 [Orbilia oligospora]|uniref:Uncharacterized protein n=1 Tax=Orbilia oligospora TaxID=2813651 RepID=A0A7C8J5B9_ORBOL|nr:hypothetical protein TWF103_004260 [Orbilia oligospora]KAF3090386.1 hypothetical protein TWF102_009345 [Orbilia oligospora]KAF3096574.1 hypothetical protein TWF706_007629 [Orbilia oligospora]KAF3141061.1 hypothetical protein TWF594_006103 [Orbilia oligospora]KAF3155244.1 hypothetical protein TWF569_009771 [Orbilia oligospora]